MSNVGLLIPNARKSTHGFFSLAVDTGILAVGVAADNGNNAGHLIALRNSKAAAWYITYIRLKLMTRTAPSTAQFYGITLRKLTAFSAAATGGGTGGANANLFARDVAYASRDATTGKDGSGLIARVAGDAALTAGTQTHGAKILSLEAHELVAAATVQVGNRERVLQSHDRHALAVIKNTEGLLLVNQILTANALAYTAGIELGGILVG